MNKYRITYDVAGRGVFFVEANSPAEAFGLLYSQFVEDNSLIVYAEYPQGFEILSCVEHPGEFPARDTKRVTYHDEDLDEDDEYEEDVVVKVNFAQTGLFDFDT